MGDIGIGIWVFGLFRLLVSLVNFFTHIHIYHKKRVEVKQYEVYDLSILIPVRNEEHAIVDLLDDLINLPHHPNEIIIYDDQSTDRSVGVIKEYTLHYPFIKLIHGSELPAGWLGKNFACFQLAKSAKGKKLIFLDADVRIKPDFIPFTLGYMKRYRLLLLSLFPVQKMPDKGTYLAVPIMNWILLSLLPLPLIRLTNFQSFSAANGQCMLFEAETYHLIQPHYLCKGNRVEDIAIQREYKKRKLKTATLTSNGNICCIMYHSYREAIDGFTKNVFQFFGGSVLLTYLFTAITTVAPFFLFVYNSLPVSISYLVFIITVHALTSFTSKQSPGKNLLYIIPQQFTLWMIIISATIKRNRKKILWKDRNIAIF